MSDLELMELVAKAAGLHEFTQINGRYAVRTRYTGLQDWSPWNPLDDDGDALRLAVKLAMYVALDNAAREVVACAAEGSVVKERCGDDPYAATRRAIVRAAAEIGRQMGGGNAE